jgi:hypothetical protein
MGRLARHAAYRFLYRADQLQHHLRLHWRWICDGLDIAHGLMPEDWDINYVPNTRVNRCLARFFREES